MTEATWARQACPTRRPSSPSLPPAEYAETTWSTSALPAGRQVRRVPFVDVVQPAPRTRFARPTAMKRPASTEVNTRSGEHRRQEQAACLSTGATKRAQETGQRVRQRPLTTKETPLLPMVGLRPVVASRPTWFALVRQDDFNELSSQHGRAVNKEHAESPEARPVGPRERRISGSRHSTG